MPDTAVPRTGWTPGPAPTTTSGAAAQTQKYEQWLTAQVRANPSFPIPPGYQKDSTGNVTHVGEPLINKIAKVAPYVGFGAAGGIGAAAYLGGAGAAGGAASSGAATSGGAGAVPSLAVSGGLPAGAGASMAGTGAATAAAGAGGMDPLTFMLLSGGSSGLLGYLQQSTQGAQQRQMAAQQDRLARDLANQQTATTEGTQDPFRQQMFQGKDLSLLDRWQNQKMTPTTFQMPDRYAQYAPQISGGYSYENSPELTQWLNMLKQNVAGGNVAPTMTDPKNYGKTAALNLPAIQAGGVDPATVNAATTPPRDPTQYLTGVQTRAPGGMGTADTRGSDVSVSQASSVLNSAIQSELGRPARPGEVEAMLASQGLKPGDRYVGQAGLLALLNGLRGSSTSQTNYTGRG